MSLNPSQKRILQALVSTAAKASHELGINLIQAESFLKNVWEFVKINHQKIEDKEYYFLLNIQQNSGNILTKATVRKGLNSNRKLFEVDQDLNLVTQRQCKRFTDFSQITKAPKGLGVKVEGSYLTIVLCGWLQEEQDALLPDQNPPEYSLFKRPFSDFDKILKDHMQNSVDREQGFYYWENKKKRILLAGAHGTEDIFQHDLFQWLRLNLTDKLDITAEMRGHGQDQHDIRIVTTDGGKYVVEIKWLGETEKSKYKQPPRVDEGLAQVKIYLQNDSELICGYLVVYDGRCLDEHQNQSDYDSSQKHQDCHPPKILFLESESPSVVAKKSISRRRKK